MITRSFIGSLRGVSGGRSAYTGGVKVTTLNDCRDIAVTFSASALSVISSGRPIAATSRTADGHSGAFRFHLGEWLAADISAYFRCRGARGRRKMHESKSKGKRIVRPFRCPDCDLRNDLSVMSVPLPTRRYWKFGVKNCETCQGTGRVEFHEW